MLRTIDMFCGVGGSSYGARNANAKIVAGFDIWEPAVKTYNANFPEAKVFHEDIHQIDPEKIKKQIGKIDLILASPECTNHSVAKGSKERCEISKRTVFEVIRFAQTFKPRYIVIENVIQMESWSEHSSVIDALWDLQYSVLQVKLNSEDFGVPQSRKRLFLICADAQKKKTVIPSKICENPIAAHTILDRSGRYKFSQLYSDKRATATLERAERAIEALGKNEEFLLVYYGTDGAGGWQSIDKPLRTITTIDRFAYVKPSKNGHQMRMLQPEELKLAMGFGVDFNLGLNNTRRNKIKLMGNGVCPPVMEAIVRNLKN